MESVRPAGPGVQKCVSGFCIVLVMLFPLLASGQITLVDFGSSAGGNTFGLAEWNTVLKSSSMTYSSAGNDGLVVSSDPGEYGDYRGISGTAHAFSPGDKIVVTWYNNSEEVFFFTARISFTDSNAPDESDADHPWFTMRSYTDYRNTYSEILPYSYAKTVFNITDSGVHRTDGNHSLVNINLAIEWFSTYQKPYLVCDKIELLNDADVSPPAKPAGLTANTISDSKIHLSWTASSDNVGVVEYLVYMDGEIEGYSRSTEFTCVYLEPGTSYTFLVTALDATGNESAPSQTATIATEPFNGRMGVIDPSGIDYLGAIAVPETFYWGGEAIAYNPEGDGGWAGTADGHPGSIFITNVNQPEYGWVGEISIPIPVISAGRNIEELNPAVILTQPVNIRPSSVNAWDFVDIWRTGLEVVPDEGRLYSSWSVHYTVTQEKHASISWCAISNLSSSARNGAWYVGAADQLPLDAMVNDYLFSVPQAWADQHLSGKNLVTGRYRDGGLSGLGPTLYAFSRTGATPPSAGSVLSITTLLEYGPVEGTDNYHYPDAIDGYKHADEWKGAMWLSAEDQAAVAFIGNKALGHNYYGYTGESMRHDWVIADVPPPDYYETDPDGKGWRAYNRQPMILFFDPDDLAKVAGGTLEPHEPQPYTALRLDKDLFFTDHHDIASSAFDQERGLLYATEHFGYPDGQLVLHVWKVNPGSSPVRTGESSLGVFQLCQNHPNPFNPVTVIRYRIGKPSHIVIKIYNLKGQEIRTLAEEERDAGFHQVQWDGKDNSGEEVAAGVYFYRLVAEGHVQTRKMMLLR